ncbi:uncharacterized protein LOC129218410 isoform X3 [Uloborus diversus]|uniref:uncharacterized protein LOC129218410 isoform X3 n=1 Tax=Uloborus diversus TaxID=327109 RepID=UPI00240A54D9|nr:uncharacterized protein LOC129218410 isoform X3 [Uloborus diversus]
MRKLGLLLLLVYGRTQPRSNQIKFSLLHYNLAVYVHVFTFGMALYIKPPKGTVSFRNLRNYVTKRLLFLCCLKGKSIHEITSAITEEGLAEASECLIEGSMKDRISHFTLRLLCASDLELSNFFIQRETELFIYRLQFYDQGTIYKMLQIAYKQSIEVLEKGLFLTQGYHCALKNLNTIFEEMQNAYKSGCHQINVHFTAALKFVSERSCYLHMGYVRIPLEKIRILLSSNFQEILTQGLTQMQSSVCMQELEDPRIKSMRQDVLRWFYQPMNSSSISQSKLRPINITNLSCESMKFPLCMANLHEQLVKHHRLRHFSREPRRNNEKMNDGTNEETDPLIECGDAVRYACICSIF